MTSDTIAAIATPPGSGGIGIIRVSGPKAVSAAMALFRRSGGASCDPEHATPPVEWESHRLYHGFIVAPEAERVIDEVLVAVMRAPRSYTREDVVEIQAHAGPAGLRAILEQVLRQGVRLAAPGEFTRRAFLNGRIDLSQAEGVMDLIAARSQAALSAASAQVAGELREAVGKIRDALMAVMAHIEAAIDFPDEMEGELSADEMRNRLEREAIAPIADLIRRADAGRTARAGVQVVVAGRPNVGKSSLVNRLLGQERAIVTAVPGTTRDLIEEEMTLDGMSLTLTDTAGLHDTEDPVEKIGVERARERLASADLVLLVTEANVPPGPGDRDVAAAAVNRPLIWVVNKVDLADDADIPSPPDGWARWVRVQVSAKVGTGMDELRRRMAAAVEPAIAAAEHGAIPNLRHRKLLDTAMAAVRDAITTMESGHPFELIAIDLNSAAERLGDILGETVRPDVLDEIFTRFCIGK